MSFASPSAAVKTRHALPYRGHFDGRTQYVFSKTASLDGHESVLCLPLVVRDHAIGTLTLAAKRKGAFPDATGTPSANAFASSHGPRPDIPRPSHPRQLRQREGGCHSDASQRGKRLLLRAAWRAHRFRWGERRPPAGARPNGTV